MSTHYARSGRGEHAGGPSEFDFSYNACPVESIDSSDSPVHALFFAPKIHR